MKHRQSTASPLAIVALWFGISATVANAALVDVFFYSGQSNASGRVSAGYVPDARDSQVQYLYGTDGPASHGHDSGGVFSTLGPLASGYYGSEIVMGRNLFDLGYNPAIIKVSRGGTSLGGEWNSRAPGSSWTQWQDETSNALAEIVANGDTPVLRGFFWLQGENDSINSDHSASYQSNFSNLVTDVSSFLGTDYDVSEMRFVTALTRDRSGWDYASTVRSAQQSVMDSHAMGAWFDTQDLTTFDNVHYDASAIATIGDRFITSFESIPVAVAIPEPSTFSVIALSSAILLTRRRRRAD